MGYFRNLNRSLKVRFVVFLVLILTIAIGASSYLHLSIQYEQLMDMTKEQLNDIAVTIERSIKTSMEEGRSDDVKRIIESKGELPDLNKIRIFSRRGVVLVSSKPEERGEIIDERDMQVLHQKKFATVYDMKALQQPVFSIIKPILNQPTCYPCHGSNPSQMNGVLQVDVSMEKVHKRIATVRKIMITSALITISVLILSMIFLLSYLVNRPVSDLIRTMRVAKEGDLTVRVKPYDTLEFEELGQNFNAMIARLEQAQLDLKGLHEQQMERVDRLATLGELAAGIAHEIKNPIAGIGGAIQVLMQDYPEEDPRREVFEEIVKQIDRIDRDVKDLLSYARTDKPSLEETNIHLILQEAIFLIRDPAAQHNVELETNFYKRLPKVEVDEKQIQQVLVNLGLNAIQAMSKGGALHFTTGIYKNDDGNDYVSIQVQDNGKGIPTEKMAKIFTPFYTTRHTGTGLGLSISQKIIHQHNGKIEVTSEFGKGTCFTVLLPLKRERSSVTAE